MQSLLYLIMILGAHNEYEGRLTKMTIKNQAPQLWASGGHARSSNVKP